MTAPVANPYEGLSPDDKKRWVCVYPAYINSRKTIHEGRRIPKDKATANPLCCEICDVCVSQGLNAEVEGKLYPREQMRDFIHSGRVRVQLRDEEGRPCHEKITTKRELFLMLGEMIPKLKSRQTRSGGGAEASSGGGGTQGGGASQGGGGSKRKKGRKGR